MPVGLRGRPRRHPYRLLAPATRARAVPECLFLERLLAVSRACGITRLADLTGLDRVGLPVWQAVRPAGRALSVHQGKGASATAAKIGALCEAIESHSAENAPADGPLCAFGDLPERERAPDPADYARIRQPLPAGERIRWCEARNLVSGGRLFLPHELVSLDFTLPPATCFERSSSGLAVGTSENEAIEAALLELLERDAEGEWRRAPPLDRMAASLALESVPFAWLHAWRNRFAALGIELRIFAVPAVEGTPVFLCFIAGGDAFGAGCRAFFGSGADGDPERSLFKALAEAVQSRLTFIAGARDDILPSHYAGPSAVPVLMGAPPVPPGFAARSWSEIEPAVGAAIPERLIERGYRQIAIKPLSQSGVPVAKAFVPGLASAERTRRPGR